MHAHPDDETIATGGTIARYAAEGVRVTLVTCTLGEEGEIIPPELARLGPAEADQLGGYRAGELAAAGAALGVTDQRYLGGIGRWRDSGMAGTPSIEHPRAFVQGSQPEQVAQLAEILAEVRPQVVVTYDEFGGYGHPDHIRAHEITMAAADECDVPRVFHVVQPATALAEGLAALRDRPDVPFRVPAAGELPAVPDARVTTAVDIGAHLDAKVAALRAHATQVSVPEPATCFALSNGIAQPLLDTEYYVVAARERGRAGDIEQGVERDLFAGLDR
ncbi:N-acetyl-1-D-myo-inositol-2-amino-2-deoxy-alpha-D-glucopyranoside deacetylase [Amycolatopsis arida]|uniref:1D-myo-inositol 2-acetamido-2-deoxy-alpha-D-glucopyranoside deacetylase n=1 Tax=Amycolatopsis arida TaxID=587909 RepID=A0A1I5PLV4_9PSEU|nr:N-acetyl-1-D-myo-inositol-2-amino-2-deoxy-alpha-D-glucopyranoside deacetylase [Amycolatopsis arida]SFP35044.1 N-acetyl-1-D-myo-inositol-2-amino-2-deoxy-alpha-D-glucopyranoside deacetylase [Amycolatopsis arida]